MKYKRPTPRGGVYTRPHQELVMNELPFIEAQVKRVPRPARGIICWTAVLLPLVGMVSVAAPEHLLPAFLTETDPATGDPQARTLYVLAGILVFLLWAITMEIFAAPIAGRITPATKAAKAAREEEVGRKHAPRILEKFQTARSMGYSHKSPRIPRKSGNIRGRPDRNERAEFFLRFAEHRAAGNRAKVQNRDNIHLARAAYTMLEDDIVRLSIIEEQVDDHLRSRGVDPASAHHTWNRPPMSRGDRQASRGEKQRP
ncbi:hypothetical protein [Nocardiopsis halophila]|uniref:hypothetical protein n=1 Tax=Nocardiopsis halophila TaxID=141692 RepID=UPI00034BA173|nr:hypothetical protein [Nocardiopsis halophila]